MFPAFAITRHAFLGFCATLRSRSVLEFNLKRHSSVSAYAPFANATFDFFLHVHLHSFSIVKVFE
jgi:hypothetical protein